MAFTLWSFSHFELFIQAVQRTLRHHSSITWYDPLRSSSTLPLRVKEPCRGAEGGTWIFCLRIEVELK